MGRPKVEVEVGDGVDLVLVFLALDFDLAFDFVFGG